MFNDVRNAVSGSQSEKGLKEPNLQNLKILQSKSMQNKEEKR